jgi:hypothetical protein
MHLGMPQDLTWYKLLTDWGSLIGGGFALVAGVIAYLAGRTQATATQNAAELQAGVEREKHDQEVETIRQSIAIELRQVVGRAFNAHKLLAGLSTKTDGQITARMVDNSASVPVPIVYPAIADRIAFLKSEAMDVVIVYQLIEIGREGAARLLRSRTPDDIGVLNVAVVAEAFLQACLYARDILPKLPTGVALHDEKDANLINMITEQATAWEDVKAKWRNNPPAAHAHRISPSHSQ